MSKLNVLLVENSVNYGAILLASSDSKCIFTSCRDIKSATEIISNQTFDIIFLDLHLPDGNSIDFCHQIAKVRESINSFVVFISSESTLESRLRAFNAGAKDFINKGIDEKELAAKMKALFEYKSKLRQHIAKMNKKTQILSSENFKVVIDNNALITFYKKCLYLASAEQLTKNLSDFFNHWNLNYITRIAIDDNCTYIKNEDELPTPIELDLLTELGSKGSSVQSFSTNTYFKYGNVELLIKNMPIEDELSYGRLKDLFHFVAEVIDARYIEQMRFNRIEKLCEEISVQLPENTEPQFIQLINTLTEQVNALKSLELEEDDDDDLF